MSHFIFRGINRGAARAAVLQRAGHMHQRMARMWGDLAADVPDPSLDWESNGMTYEAMEAATDALCGGPSSRCIVGESGKWHLVEDALQLDARIVPLMKE